MEAKLVKSEPSPDKALRGPGKSTYVLHCVNLEEVKAWITAHPNHFYVRKVGSEYVGWTVKDADEASVEVALEQLINSNIIKSWYKDSDKPFARLARTNALVLPKINQSK